MSNAIVSYQTSLMKYNPTTLDEIIKLADLFAASGFFSAENNQRQSAAQLAVKILAGQELGFTPFAAANGMYIVKGKCAPGANLMAAKVKATGRYDYRVTEMTDTRVSIDFLEGGKLIGTSTFTSADANKAQTQNMGKFPRNMLFARAMSNGVKWYTPDIFNGVAVYTPDELGATVDYETGEIIESTQAAPMLAEYSQPQPETKPGLKTIPTIERDGALEYNPGGDDEQSTAIPAHADEFVANLLEEIKTPADAWKWAADGKYTENEHSARTRWTAIVKEQGGYTPAKFQTIATAFVTHYFNKQAKPVMEAA
jgi:hypothetical protein